MDAFTLPNWFRDLRQACALARNPVPATQREATELCIHGCKWLGSGDAVDPVVIDRSVLGWRSSLMLCTTPQMSRQVKWWSPTSPMVWSLALPTSCKWPSLKLLLRRWASLVWSCSIGSRLKCSLNLGLMPRSRRMNSPGKMVVGLGSWSRYSGCTSSRGNRAWRSCGGGGTAGCSLPVDGVLPCKSPERGG